MSDHVKIENFAIQKRIFEEKKTLVQSYSDLFIGKRGWYNLIKYELIMLLCSWVPGALGLVLRSRLYPLLLGRVGRGVFFGANVALRHPHKIHLGDNVVIDDNCVLDAKGDNNKGIFIGNDVFVGRNSVLYCKDGDIYIDDNVTIGYCCDVMSANVVKMGKNILIAAYCHLHGGGHSFDRLDIPIRDQERSGKGIVLEDGVWLGSKVTVLDGLSVGRDSIVGANAVVSRNIPPRSIAVGVPAKVIRTRGEGGQRAADDLEGSA